MSTAADPSHPISLSGDSSPISPTFSSDSSPSSSSSAAPSAAAGGSDDPTTVDQIASSSNPSAAGDDAAVPTSPRIGMCFETEEDAYEFYKAYAARLGFVVRKSNKSKNSRHTVTRRLFVCSKQGFRQEPKKPRDETAAAAAAASPSHHRCPDSRTGCLASLTIKLLPSGNAFRVTDFVAEHNHPLASAAPAVSLALLPPSSSHHTTAAVASLPDPRDGPRTDMHFQTEDDAYTFYNCYAEHAGFSVRRSYKKRKRGVIVSRIFVCSREGVSDRAKHESLAIVNTNASTGASGTHRPGPPPTRTGCQARMFLRRYEAMLEEHRSKRLHADVDGSQVTLPIPSLRMLKQASSAYTPEAFKMFQASRAARSEEATSYIESQSSVLLKHLDDILQTGYPDIGNHAVASSSQAVSFVGNQLPDHTSQARAVAQTTNGIMF
ncbi:hypothetical protein ABZP36_000948 [Zizania latifolia]